MFNIGLALHGLLLNFRIQEECKRAQGGTVISTPFGIIVLYKLSASTSIRARHCIVLQPFV